MVMAVVPFVFAVTLLQKPLGQSPLLFALSLYDLFGIVELVNTADLEW